MTQFQIAEWNRRFIREEVKTGEICIDATAGTGRDTVFLAELVGRNGRVLAYDIQQEALRQTEERLRVGGFKERVDLFCKSHTLR